ncbi:hypothetical protein [Micromonospora chersina]|uniref:hypothetical protein n=1 Tax=Micromonospora chersina TaxID=47854 RepID=UPI0033A3BE45
MSSGNVTPGRQDQAMAGEREAQDARMRALVWGEIVDAMQQIEEGGEPSRLAVLLEHRSSRWRRYAILAPEPGYASAANIAAAVDEAKVAELTQRVS